MSIKKCNKIVRAVVAVIVLAMSIDLPVQAIGEGVALVDPNDLSPKIADGTYQADGATILPNFEMDMSVSDSASASLQISEDFVLTADNDILLIGTVQGQYIQGVPILNENGQLNQIVDRPLGVVLRLDPATKAILWARVVNDESGNYSTAPQYNAANKWTSRFVAIEAAQDKSVFFIGGEVRNYYGDSGGSVVVAKAIDANGNFSVARTSYVNTNIPNATDAKFLYCNDIVLEDGMVKIVASARYASKDNEVIRFSLNPYSALNYSSSEYNRMSYPFWNTGQHTGVLNKSSKGVIAYIADVNGVPKLRVSFRRYYSGYFETELFPGAISSNFDAEPNIFLEDGPGDIIYVVLATKDTWYIATLDIESEAVVARNSFAMDAETTLQSVYFNGVNLLLGGGTFGRETVFDGEATNSMNGFVLPIDEDLQPTSGHLLRSAQNNSLEAILHSDKDDFEAVFRYEGVNNDGYIYDVSKPADYTINTEAAHLLAGFGQESAPVLFTGNPILFWYTGERFTTIDEMEGVSASITFSGITTDISQYITKNEFQLYKLGVQEQYYQVEYLPKSGNMTTGKRTVQAVNVAQTPYINPDYVSSHEASWQVGDAIPANELFAIGGLDGQNTVSYQIAALGSDSITVHAVVTRAEGSLSAEVGKDIVIPLSDNKNTAVINGTDIVVAAGRYTDLQQVRDEGHFHLEAYTFPELTPIDTANITLSEATPVDWNTPGTYVINAVLAAASGYTAEPIQLRIRVVDVGNPVVDAVSTAAYNPAAARVDAHDDINGAGIYTANWTIYDANNTAVKSGAEAIDALLVMKQDIPIDIGNLPDGNYTVQVSVEDRIGHRSNTEAAAFIIDNTPPLITALPEMTYERGTMVSEQEFLAAISASADDGSAIVSHFSEAVNLGASGEYAVTLHAADAAGNNAIPVTVIVHVQDTINPKLTADSSITYERGAEKTEIAFLNDVHALLNEPGSITSDFVTTVDLTVTGAYTVTLSGTDVANNPANSVTVIVTVVDDIAPVLSADAAITYERLSAVDETHFFADIQASLSELGTVSSNFAQVVDFSVTGNYIVTLQGEDNSGNAATPVEVTVSIVDTVAPVLTADTTITYERTSDITEGQFLSDVHAGLNEPGIIRSNFAAQVNMAVAGSYPVTIAGKDNQGIASNQIKVTVTVEDTTAPILTADAAITYERGTSKDEASFLSEIHALLNEPGMITSDFSSRVIMAESGTYTVTISGRDTAGNASNQVIVRVTVRDTTEPVLTAQTVISYPLYTDVDEAQFFNDIQATLSEPGTITSDFATMVDVTATGPYLVTVSGADTSGIQAEPLVISVLMTDEPNTVTDESQEEMIQAYPFSVHLDDLQTTDFVIASQAKAWNYRTANEEPVTLSSPKPTTAGEYDVSFATANNTMMTTRVVVEAPQVVLQVAVPSRSYPVNNIPSNEQLIADYGVAAGLQYSDSVSAIADTNIRLTIDRQNIIYAEPGTYTIIFTATDGRTGVSSSASAEYRVYQETTDNNDVPELPATGLPLTETISLGIVLLLAAFAFYKIRRK